MMRASPVMVAYLKIHRLDGFVCRQQCLPPSTSGVEMQRSTKLKVQHRRSMRNGRRRVVFRLLLHQHQGATQASKGPLCHIDQVCVLRPGGGDIVKLKYAGAWHLAGAFGCQHHGVPVVLGVANVVPPPVLTGVATDARLRPLFSHSLPALAVSCRLLVCVDGKDGKRDVPEATSHIARHKKIHCTCSHVHMSTCPQHIERRMTDVVQTALPTHHTAAHHTDDTTSPHLSMGFDRSSL